MQKQSMINMEMILTCLFGPAYKGIPLSVVTATAYSQLYGKKFAIAQIEKKRKITALIKEVFLAAV